VIDDVGREAQVLGAGRAVEDVDVPWRHVSDRRDDDDVGDVAEVDRPVGVVVGEVRDQRRHDARDLAEVAARPHPLDLGLERIRWCLDLALADRVHVVRDVARVDRSRRHVGLDADVEQRGIAGDVGRVRGRGGRCRSARARSARVTRTVGRSG
jgi:hypothetical protein